ncbi:MAG: hypothetical protein ABSG74_09145 [Candidatus Bathyarchaeia archaeon]
MSRIAWPSISRGGGNLSEHSVSQLRNLLNEFGTVLEEEASKAQINILIFPLFREFNLVACLTADDVLYAIAPNIGGLPTFSWQDWHDKVNPPKGRDLVSLVERELGWTSVWTLSFPRSVLESEFTTRKDVLQTTARQWIESAISEAERQARIVKLRPIFKGREFLVEPNLCFVLLPFKEPFLRIFKDHIRPTLEEIGLRVMNSDDIFSTKEIMESIWEYVNKARIIVADVTGRNSNVFYELGMAHTVGKPVIILTQDESDVPFDLRHLRYYKYTDNEQGWKRLRENLKKIAQDTLASSVRGS